MVNNLVFRWPKPLFCMVKRGLMVDTQHGIPTLESMNGWIPEVREGLVQMIFRISIG